MELELNQTKQGNNRTLLSHKMTNEPIATVDHYKWGAEVEWHPDFKLLHPVLHDNLIHNSYRTGSNIAGGRPLYRNVQDAAKSVQKRAKEVYDDKLRPDPVKTSYVGISDQKNSYGHDSKLHHWNVHDDETGEVIGRISSRETPDKIQGNSTATGKIFKQYVDKHGISDEVLTAANKKHPGESLENIMHRMRYIQDNKGKEPRFIGDVSSRQASNNIYKTKLQPEEASNAYEEVLKKKLGDKFTFTRHSPTTFMAHKPAEDENSSSETHHIISLPGELHHVVSTADHPNHPGAKKNSNIIESKS